MVSSYWAKVFIEMIDDRKTATLPDSSWRRFVECILLAKELDEDGYLPSVADMAWRLRVDPDALDDDLTRLALAGLLERREDDRWFVVNFAKRQAHMSGNERVTRHRQSKRKQEYYNDESNDIVTSRYTEKRREEKKREEGEGESGAIAPAHPPATSPRFVPVSGELQKQKTRARIDELLEPSPLPDVIAAAPPAMLMMQVVSGYWPGDNNRDFLVEKLGASPDEATLKQAFKLWSAAGNKPTNYAGICDWYQELLRNPAWTPQDRFKNGNGHGKPTAPKSVSTPAPGSQPVTW